MRITPGTQSLQTLKAQQAWEARRAAKTGGQQLAPQEMPTIAGNQPATVVAPTSTAASIVGQASQWANPQWNNTVKEIQQIAERAGFVGVNEQDIRRAYSQGASLLADYRV